MNLCPDCGQALPADAPHGLCPGCLALLGATPPPGEEEPLAELALIRYFGDYEILGEIARGGMGVVYRARQLSLNRVVAIKMILSGQLASPVDVQRFRAEAEAAASLQHPNIVAIHEVGEHDGQCYFSMDYIEGRNLAQLVRENPLSPARAAGCIQTVAEAIHFAHQRGTLHRDLKPSNVLIDVLGQPRVTDFGLAKRLNDPELGTSNQERTVSGQVLGTPSFMPPEQAAARHGEVGPRSDVYSLGAILYHLLTGRPPFLGETVYQTLQQVAQSDPPGVRLLAPAVPRDLETICLKCLEKEPARRYATAQNLAEDLGRFLRGEPVRARPLSAAVRAARWCRRRPAAAALLLVLTLAMTGAGLGSLWHLRQMGRAAARLRDNFSQMRQERAAIFFEDGKPHLARATLALACREDPTNAVVLARLYSSLTHGHFALPARPSLMLTSGVEELTLSADSQRLAARSLDGFVRLWDLTTGTLLGQLEAPQSAISQVMFSANGKRLAAAGSEGIVSLWNARTGAHIKNLPHLGRSLHIDIDDAGQVLATAGADGPARLFNATNGELRAELGGQISVLDLAFGRKGAIYRVSLSADGRRAATAALNGRVSLWDCAQPAKALRSWEAPARDFSKGIFLHLLASNLLIVAEKEIRSVSTEAGHGLWTNTFNGVISRTELSRDERRLSVILSSGAVHVLETQQGQPVGPPLQHKDICYHARFSPDGALVVTASQDSAARVWDVATGALVGEPLFHDWFVFDAVFGPAGDRVATACMDGGIRFYDVRPFDVQPVWLAGTNQHKVLGFDPGGSRLLIAADAGVLLYEVPSGRLVTGSLDVGYIRAAHYDATNNRVATLNTNGEVRFWNATDGRETVPALATAQPRLAAFSPDGAALAVLDGKSVRTWNVTTRQPLSPQPMQSEFSNAWGGMSYALTFSPDGQSLALASHHSSVEVWDPRTGERRCPPLNHVAPCASAVFSPDSRRLVTGCMDFSARVWDLSTGRPLTPPLRHRATVVSAEFSPDGTKIVTASQDHTAWVWDARTGRKLAGPMTHANYLDMATFSPDGQRVATCAWDNSVRVWDAQTGLPVTDSLRLNGRVRRVQFSPGGRFLAAAAMGGRACLWDLSGPAGAAPDWLAPLAEAVAGQRLHPDGRSEPVEADAFFALRSRILHSAPATPWQTWARWFFADRTSRPARP